MLSNPASADVPTGEEGAGPGVTWARTTGMLLRQREGATGARRSGVLLQGREEQHSLA